uniref:Serine hydrolase domain-containing protein n=1 Tax=Hyaloperonospora arabidopsidis (strain Emoy2) TaxID=559515 RepID=M4B8I9_HYAAE
MTTLRVMSRATGRKLRLLCLHGIYQDAETFTVKTKPLRGVSGIANVDFVYLDGPFSVVPPILTRPNKRLSKRPSTSRQKKKSEYRAWWRPLGIHEEVDAGRLARDWDVLVSFLREQIDEIGDVDGVFGFSQGASLAAWMCSERLRQLSAVLVGLGHFPGHLVTAYLRLERLRHPDCQEPASCRYIQATADGRELRGDFRARPRSCDPQMQRMQGAIRVIPNPSADEIAQ